MGGLRPSSHSGWISTAVKIDKDLLERLDAAADERVLGRNYLINKAISDLLDRLIPLNQLERQGYCEEHEGAMEDTGSQSSIPDSPIPGSLSAGSTSAPTSAYSTGDASGLR